jgi:hypothetical protein
VGGWGGGGGWIEGVTVVCWGHFWWVCGGVGGWKLDDVGYDDVGGVRKQIVQIRCVCVFVCVWGGVTVVFVGVCRGTVGWSCGDVGSGYVGYDDVGGVRKQMAQIRWVGGGVVGWGGGVHGDRGGGTLRHGSPQCLSR